MINTGIETNIGAAVGVTVGSSPSSSPAPTPAPTPARSQPLPNEEWKRRDGTIVQIICVTEPGMGTTVRQSSSHDFDCIDTEGTGEKFRVAWQGDRPWLYRYSTGSFESGPYVIYSAAGDQQPSATPMAKFMGTVSGGNRFEKV